MSCIHNLNIPIDHGLDNCLKRLNQNRSQTNFEQQNGITATSDFELTADFDDIKFYERQKSDGTTTFAFCYRSGKSDFWLACIPSDNQVRILSDFLARYYLGVNKRNAKR